MEAGIGLLGGAACTVQGALGPSAVGTCAVFGRHASHSGTLADQCLQTTDFARWMELAAIGGPGHLCHVDGTVRVQAYPMRRDELPETFAPRQVPEPCQHLSFQIQNRDAWPQATSLGVRTNG